MYSFHHDVLPPTHTVLSTSNPLPAQCCSSLPSVLSCPSPILMPFLLTPSFTQPQPFLRRAPQLREEAEIYPKNQYRQSAGRPSTPEPHTCSWVAAYQGESSLPAMKLVPQLRYKGQVR
ncbi:hypothetical protein E2C01_042826 [Portunus trituberculatus]|uniref:Uncharacterized protein n=1 Tax=Portunus trituberculatus TaxID=210409 RepID=A0A5B7FVU3_PORTR|nr:hypothetical protein [Portunus trituberculatus]